MRERSVLIVDDDAGIRLIADLSLSEGAGWQVVTAASGEEALAILEKERPDLIVLDVMMPGMSGMSVLAAIRKRGLAEDVPVIFMTAKVQSQEMSAYSELGVAGVISKPFDPVGLAREMDDLCNVFRARNLASAASVCA